MWTLAAVLPGAAPEDQAAVVGSAIGHIVVARGQAPVIAWPPWVESLRAAAVGAD